MSKMPSISCVRPIRMSPIGRVLPILHIFTGLAYNRTKMRQMDLKFVFQIPNYYILADDLLAFHTKHTCFNVLFKP